ncbi:uncharacterized protein LOC132297076 [Cornus florida]|uniref:uncharacterized protein LOC132297076 n=1 Tax=Cornus florida TaxID=4283 RepID=UPI0028A1107F|nr:uncharacterized protein LOC132297076 [Cornus florida]
MASQLYGPPELHNQPSNGGATAAMETDPPTGFTENRSLTYLATGNPCLDFFFHIVPDTDSKSLIKRLSKSWDYNPVKTLKLLCNLRGVRGTGKLDKKNFYKAALWLHKFHPKTLACNAGVMAEFGYFKDLPEILLRLLEGPKVRSTLKSEWEKKKNKKGKGNARKMYFLGKRKENRANIEGKSRKARKRERENKRRSRAENPTEQRIESNMEKVKVERGKARVLRKERELEKAKKALGRYTQDPDYRFLHDKISEVFAGHLRFDIQRLNNGMINKISLAAKWCPSIDSSFDKSTLICESIAKRVFPREEYEEYRGIEEAHYLYRVRDRLRKEVLVPLHKALELPEVYMSEKHWDTLPYKRVASVAMKNYKNIFLHRDNKRFKEYLQDVKTGKAKISAGALLPHEIIASLKDQDGGKVAELQWARMVEDLAEKGKLRNCIAVCDVSGSMEGKPMEVCVALGLLISELSEDPWKGKVISFSENPQLHRIKGDSLEEKINFVKQMDWGGNTDFQKVFDRILKVAVKGKLSDEQMIEKIFVFSDMEFDQASNHHSGYGYSGSEYLSYSASYSEGSESASYSEGSESGSYSSDDLDSEIEKNRRHQRRSTLIENKKKKARPKGWETDYEVIQRKFREKGFNKVPEIVFWNLRHSSATPVTAKQSGVALVSGFSKNMVTMFLEEDDGVVNPEAVMEKAISGELYQKLLAYD